MNNYVEMERNMKTAVKSFAHVNHAGCQNCSEPRGKSGAVGCRGVISGMESYPTDLNYQNPTYGYDERSKHERWVWEHWRVGRAGWMTRVGRDLGNHGMHEP